MLNIDFLKKSGFFEEKILLPGEYLFYEGDKDDNIYIILSGELYIEKFTNKDRNESKILAKLHDNEIFGEAALNNNLPKQVSIKSNIETKLIFINAKSSLNDFSLKYTNEAFDLLKHIIHLSNTRLNQSNRLITSSYKISHEISNIKDFTLRSLFELIEKIKNIIDVSEIIFLEENPILEEYLILRYKTSVPGQMQDEIIKVSENKLDLNIFKKDLDYCYLQNIKVGNKNQGYLIFLRDNNDFSENEIKIISTIGVSFSNVLKQKELISEQKNKDYIKNI